MTAPINPHPYYQIWIQSPDTGTFKAYPGPVKVATFYHPEQALQQAKALLPLVASRLAVSSPAWPVPKDSDGL
jgi:hypothetical protein